MWEKLKNKINYFGDESNLHGFRFVFSMSYIPVFKRLFWLIMLVSCVLGATAILRGALKLYSEDVVSFSVETNFLNWDTPFPAITVCDQMDSEKVKAVLAANNLPSGMISFFKEVVFWNVKYCKSCNNCKMNQTCLENFQEFVHKIRVDCSVLLTDCWWDDEYFPCCERSKNYRVMSKLGGWSSMDETVSRAIAQSWGKKKNSIGSFRCLLTETAIKKTETDNKKLDPKFLPVETEYGICFSFNSRLTNNDSKILVINRKAGLPRLLLSATQPITIRVTAPDDRISVSMENILGRYTLPLVTDYEAILKAEQTISDISVTSLSQALRGCLFKHEVPAFAHLWPFGHYTYNSCIFYCRTIEQMERCNCTHHFMPKLKGIPMCGISGMACLNKNKDEFLSIDCECPMACEEIQYKTTHIFLNRHMTITDELLKRGTRAMIRLGQLPALRVRRHAIRDTLGLVVDIGGVIGVFFSASLLSIIEIVYLFCIRRGP